LAPISSTSVADDKPEESATATRYSVCSAGEFGEELQVSAPATVLAGRD
jgi:hypothetical protein